VSTVTAGPRAYITHRAAESFAFYNFCGGDKTLRFTPAMEAGIADRVWDIRDLLH